MPQEDYSQIEQSRVEQTDKRLDKQRLKAARQARNFARWRWLFTVLTGLVCTFLFYEVRHPDNKEKGILCFILLLADVFTGATAIVGWVYKWRPLSTKLPVSPAA